MKNKIFIIVFSLFFTYLFSYYSYSVEPDEILNNKEQETRARNISKNIRCLVCQNQSIDESNAPLAKDLRILIRDKIKNGKEDEEIYNFLRERYGDFIFLKPTLTLNTFLLWFLPFIFLSIGLIIIFLNNKKS
tara:strand:+ start:620 stop:1018 length:399 start_codon:yes stop_codon:yes gene_type:complete